MEDENKKTQEKLQIRTDTEVTKQGFKTGYKKQG